ncbi:hypothetical protein Y88_0717 [Novosphingobium nitrogenifigens DSM 19370]|uniref:Cell division protein ZapA n=1 Tax=Novosphingobium nitrogenifigens DSM 19370 TaxID=983920 RepID=F1Z9T2_9SPHN|nr:cell division protein ZapA [Novosphingobium nitrogenifigens]EGD58660.1 hypothetical protein Y88_0717 [Novosphingobium nitrogenifigens DSM 19370]
MKNVTLTIGGRSHAVAVPVGEEAHIETLARMVDDRVRRLRLGQGQTEVRMLLFATLMLADELLALEKAGPAPVPAPPPPAPPAPPPAPEPEVVRDPIAPELLARVADLAARVEKLAERLEQSGEAS